MRIDSLIKWLSASSRGKELLTFDAFPEEYEMFVTHVLHRGEIGKAIGRVIEAHFKGEPVPSFALDTACGTGIITNAVEPHIVFGGRVVGCDISCAMLEYARRTKNPRIEWHTASFENLAGIPDDSVDVYTMVAAYRFVKDHGRFMSEMERVLSPRGIAILPKTRKNISKHRMRRMKRMANEVGLDMKIHITRFKSLRNALRCHEFLLFTKRNCR